MALGEELGKLDTQEKLDNYVNNHYADTQALIKQSNAAQVTNEEAANA